MNRPIHDRVRIALPRRSAALVALLAIGLPGELAPGELLWDQPWGPEWARAYPALNAAAAATRAQEGLAALMGQSEVIFSGGMADPRISSTREGTLIQASVRPDTLLKGSIGPGSLRLTFMASATGITAGARHVFFMRRGARKSWTVLRACFLQPHPLDRIRLVGAVEGSASVALAALMHMAGGGGPTGPGSLPRTAGVSPPQLARDLISEYRSADHGRGHTAAYLALALDPRTGGEVLRAVVKEQPPRDLSLYQLAAHRLITTGGDAGIRFVLTHLPRKVPGLGRLPEAIAFDLAVAHGKKSTLEVLKTIAKDRPDLRPSVTAALAGLAGPGGPAGPRRR